MEWEERQRLENNSNMVDESKVKSGGLKYPDGRPVEEYPCVHCNNYPEKCKCSNKGTPDANRLDDKNHPEGALRYNKGKSELSYMMDFPHAMDGLCRVMMAGTIKYDRDNWKKGLSLDSSCDSMLRHLMARKNGQVFDSETGLDHLFHVVVNAMMIAESHGIVKEQKE